jgi:hypothetical protein
MNSDLKDDHIRDLAALLKYQGLSTKTGQQKFKIRFSVSDALFCMAFIAIYSWLASRCFMIRHPKNVGPSTMKVVASVPLQLFIHSWFAVLWFNVLVSVKILRDLRAQVITGMIGVALSSPLLLLMLGNVRGSAPYLVAWHAWFIFATFACLGGALRAFYFRHNTLGAVNLLSFFATIFLLFILILSEP